MPFDPNVPQPDQDLDANVVRDQFNALNDKIDAQAVTITGLVATVDGLNATVADITAQIASILARLDALENPPVASYTASGFGDARANGSLVQVDTFNGQPLYECDGGTFYVFDTVVWTVQPTDPRVDGITGTIYGTQVGDPITGAWTPYAPQYVPAGTVS